MFKIFTGRKGEKRTLRRIGECTSPAYWREGVVALTGRAAAMSRHS